MIGRTTALLPTQAAGPRPTRSSRTSSRSTGTPPCPSRRGTRLRPTERAAGGATCWWTTRCSCPTARAPSPRPTPRGFAPGPRTTLRTPASWPGCPPSAYTPTQRAPVQPRRAGPALPLPRRSPPRKWPRLTCPAPPPLPPPGAPTRRTPRTGRRSASAWRRRTRSTGFSIHRRGRRRRRLRGLRRPPLPRPGA